MAIYKRYTNKKKTRFSWRVVVYTPTNKFDRYGNVIKEHVSVGSYPTEKEAKLAEREFLNNLDEGKIELNKDATFREVILFYLDFAAKEGRYAEGTIANYKCLHKMHLNLFDSVKVRNITSRLIRSWYKSAIEKELSPYRINDCIKLLNASFNHAIKEKQINTNPFSDMKREIIPKKLRKRFSVDELKELFKSCKESLPDYYCIFVISCMTGMRVGEYTALTVESINNSVIYLEKQYTRGELKNRLKTSSSTRVVHPSNMVLEAIQWHMDTYNIRSGLLFKNSKGNPVSAKWVWRRFNTLLEINGYPEKYCRVHDLRGQYVDLQHLVGTPTEQIAREVGHSRTSTTSDIYTQILDEVPVTMNRKMDSLFKDI